MKMFLKYMISFLFLVRGPGVLTLLPPPVNLTVESVNLQSELRWSSVMDDENVQYTVQFRVNSEFHDSNKKSSDYDDWLEIPKCSLTRERRCNLTSAFDAFINATLRIRAQNGQHVSPWSHSRPFKAIDQTLLGPPNVTLLPKPETGRLDVRIRDPFHKNYFSHELKYRLYYRTEDGKWEVYSDTLSSVSIDTFEVGLNYCVKVDYIWRSRPRPNSVPSAPKCAIISESESVKSVRILWVTAVIVLLTLGFSLMCIYMFIKNYSKFKQAMQPPIQLPEHLQEFLSREEFPQLPASSTTSSSSSEDEPFDQVSLVTIEKEVEEEELSSTSGHT